MIISRNRWCFVAAVLRALGALGCAGAEPGPGNGTAASPSAAASSTGGTTSTPAGARSPNEVHDAQSAGRAGGDVDAGAGAPSSAAAGSGGKSAAMGAAASGGSAAGRPAATSSSSGAAGMAGASAASSQGELRVDAGVYTWKQGRRSFAVDAMHGARITRFGLDDHNLLTGPDIDMLNFGATFWPSPQERWSWPPVPELDSDAYEAKQEAEAVSFTSKPGMRAKVTVEKRVRALTEGSVEITYRLTNNDSSPVSWAAWEVTRVAASGLSFFPTGSRKVSTGLPVVDQAGVTWFQHDPAKIMGDGQKFTGDGGEGWLAHVAGNTLLVKQFMDVAVDAQAPAPEAEIALYAARGYVEIEPQGPYTMLMPGESLTWTVRWIVAELPAQLDAALGSSALVDFVRQLLPNAGL